jgi:ascorbate PTS system EIIB component
MEIITVCGHGAGSSLILRLNIEAVLKEMNIAANVSACDVSSYKGTSYDLIVSTKDLSGHFKGISKPVILLDNVLDKEAIKNCIMPYII